MNLFAGELVQFGYLPLGEGALQRPLFVIQERDSVEVGGGRDAAGSNICYPIFALKVAAFGNPSLPYVEAMAAQALETIRMIQPAGPYRLAALTGCLMVGHEIAVQLNKLEQVVEFTGAVDITLRKRSRGNGVTAIDHQGSS